jgi:signal transduction histidine kinase
MTLNINDLSESSDFLNILIDHISSAFFIVAADLKVNNSNKAFGELFQQLEDQIPGKLFGNALGCIYTADGTVQCGTTRYCDKCDLRKALLSNLTDHIPMNKGIFDHKFSINGKTENKYLNFTTKLISFDHAEMVLIIMDDNTELHEQHLILEQKNAKLEDLNVQKNKFLSIAAHDLRSPIGNILTITDILKASHREMDEDELVSMFDDLSKLSLFSLSLINDLLDFSKIEAGKLTLKRELKNYVDFLKNRLKLYKAYTKAHHMHVDFVADEGIPDLEFDDNKIEQVLNNLVNNAVKYSFPGTSLKISAVRQKDIILTTVEDHGQGICEEELPLVFNEFHVSSTKSTNGEGSTGLGLAIVRKIVEEHGGHVWVNSELGKGSAFSFSLPLMAVHQPVL